jgi:competence protein ComEC
MQSAPHGYTFVPHPLALLAAALIAGLLATHFLSIPLMPLLLFGAAAFVVAGGAVRLRRARLGFLFIMLATMFAGALLERIEQRPAPKNQIKSLIESGTIAGGDPLELTGVLEAPPESAPASFYLTLRVEKLRFKQSEQDASGRVELMVPVRDLALRGEYEALELRYGARIRVMTTLERAENYRNPGGASFIEYLDRQGLDASGVIKSPLLLEHLADERVFLPLYLLYEWRRKIEVEIMTRFSPATAGVLDAALLGNRYNVSHSTAERFREGGTFHVLVIAGLHIGFIGGLVLLIVRRITKRRSWQFVLATAVLWCYAIAVGARPPVLRAALVFTLVALGPLVWRRARPLNALGGAALFLLVWRPGDLFDPAFVLTFLSVLAIVVLAAPLLQKLNQIGAWRPSQDTPYPPNCARWLRTFSESLFWSEREWQQELAQSTHSYKLFKTPIAMRLERWHWQRPLRYVVSAITISAIVQLGLLPLLVIYFHRVSLVSVVLNIWVGLLMALLGLVALAALVIAQLSSLAAAPLIQSANAINWLMVHSVDLFARAGVSSLRLPQYSGKAAVVYVGYYVPLVLLATALARWQPLRLRSVTMTARILRRRRMLRLAGALQLILLLGVVVHPCSEGRPDGRLRVDFLDVGQGDAALVTMPEGTTLLIDGGGRPTFNARGTNSADDTSAFERDTRSIGEAVVSEYLWWRGLDHVDYILATHADADHIDGLNDVARNFKVRVALVARTPPDDPEYAKFAETLRARSIPLTVVSAGEVLHFGNATATIYWPLPSADRNASSRNNDSIVLQLRYGQRTILMTGDVEKEGEGAIVATKNDLRSDVVKVPHHGSKTSSTENFVTATQPQFAVISVGLHSIFGHPRKEVVERWRAGGADVMTTGKRGTITISTDGRDLKVDSFVPQ